MYLVPVDEMKIEELVKPERLSSQQDISIGVTSDWGQISELALAGKVYGVIIHHAAINQVDISELQYLFNHKRLVVATIGIPANKLANIIGELSNFNDESYKCSNN